jgi:hypothetical protein
MLISELRNRLGIDIIKAFKCLELWYMIKGWKGESNWLEEVIGVEAKLIEENHVQTGQTAV